jgi:uncharacterized protein (TIGR00266 family)
MQHLIDHGQAFAWLRVRLDPGESLQAEAGSMVFRTPAIEMETRLNAGRGGAFRVLWAFIVALLRKLLGGETMFVNVFRASQPGEVALAPSLSGSIAHERLDGQRSVFVQTGSYLANTGTIDTKLRLGGLRTLFGGEGLMLLECSGQGDLFINSYGGIHTIYVQDSFVVDTGHIVAFDGTLDFTVRSVGGVKSFLFSGEGLVCEFRGQGRVLIQSRNVPALASFLTPLLPR